MTERRKSQGRCSLNYFIRIRKLSFKIETKIVNFFIQKLFHCVVQTVVICNLSVIVQRKVLISQVNHQL